MKKGKPRARVVPEMLRQAHCREEALTGLGTATAERVARLMYWLINDSRLGRYETVGGSLSPDTNQMATWNNFFQATIIFIFRVKIYKTMLCVINL